MKIFCTVHGKQAVIIGYAPGRKGRPRAVVICSGKLVDVALKDIVLDKDEALLPSEVTELRPRKQQG